jgi:antitoxin PrlF
MRITKKGQVTIPKHIRLAAGVLAGSRLSFSLQGGKIIVTPHGADVRDDRRAELRSAAAKVRSSMSPAFKQLSAQDIMNFLRADHVKRATPRGARR